MTLDRRFPVAAGGGGSGNAPTITTADEGRGIAVLGGAYALTSDAGRLPLKRFRAALATADTTALNWWALGDSITESTGASKLDDGYVYRLLRALQKRATPTGRGGFGYLNTYWTSFSGSSGSDAYWTFSGGGSTASGTSPFGGKKYVFSAGETATLTFTGTSFKIHHRQGDGTSIPFTVTIDGGAPATVTPSTTGGGNTRGVYTSSTLTRGAHTVVIAPASGANTMIIYGATLYDGDETGGIHVYNDGFFGWTSTQFLAGIGASFTDAQTLAANPALVTIHLGTNDYSTGVATATYGSNLASIIANVKSAVSNTPSFLLIVPSQRFVTSPANAWSGYAAAAKAVAAADPTNVAVLDLSDHFIDVPTSGNSYTGGLYNTDQIHPTDAGHKFIAQLALGQLLGAVEPVELGEVTAGDLAAKADDTAVVHTTGAETVAGVKTFSSLPVIPTTTPTTNGQTASKLYVDTVAAGITAGGVSDATTSVKGIVQLAGDLAGTAAAPTVPGKTTAFTVTAVKTTNYSAAANEFVPVDTTSGNVTVTFPTAPADGTRIGVKHVVRGSTNTVGLALGGSDVFNVSGGATTGTITLLNQGAIFQYKSSSAIWYASSTDLALSQLDSRYANQSTLTTKGDLYVATGSATLTRLAVGTNNQVLTADSAQTAGVKWAAASGGGITGTAAELSAVGGWMSPSANGFKLWTAPPMLGAVTTGLTAGFVYFQRIFVPVTTTISTLSIYVGTAGTSVSNSFLGLYDSSGALLSGSGDISTSLQSAGLTTGTLGSAQTITGSTTAFVWAGILVGAATSLALLRHTSTTAYTNVNLTAANSNAARGSTGSLTALPSSQTPSSLSQSNGIAFWAAAN
jgi:lysophospholipase L1-like esterase